MLLDQLISSNASSREWGVTPEDLYALAENLQLDPLVLCHMILNTFQNLYGPSF